VTTDDFVDVTDSRCTPLFICGGIPLVRISAHEQRQMFVDFPSTGELSTLLFLHLQGFRSDNMLPLNAK